MPWWGRIRSGAADPTHLAHLVGHKVYALADGDRAEVLVPLALETGRGGVDPADAAALRAVHQDLSRVIGL